MPPVTESHLMGDVVRKQEIYSGNCAGKEEDRIKAEEYSGHIHIPPAKYSASQIIVRPKGKQYKNAGYEHRGRQFWRHR